MTALVEPSKCRVALLAGGVSGEREVSLASGRGAQQALEAVGFPVTMLDPAYKEDLKSLIDGNYDVAFICLHGKHGEDGTIQGLLEVIDLPYIGSGVWSSAVSMDKAKSKVFYERIGLKTPKSVVLNAEDHQNQNIDLKSIEFPCVVKPVSEGSALGVYIVETKDSIEDALEKAFSFDKEVLVENYIAGKEITVAVLGNENPEALPVIEIIPRNEFYDYDAKYAPGGSEHICPAELSQETTKKAQRMAIDAHCVLDCAGVSRSDFMIDDAGEVWILETNTIPGMTETSLLPDAARAVNMDFSQLCTKLIEYAIEGRQQNERQG